MKFEDMINTITLGDSYKLIKEIPDKSVDLVIIDPPYEFDTSGGGGAFGTKKRKHEEIKIAKKTYRQNDDKIKNREEIAHLGMGIDYEILDELDRIMKKINIYIWCSKKQVRKLLQHYEEKECNIDILTWHKDNVLPTANNSYMNDTEYCIFAREEGVKVNGEVATKNKFYITHTNVLDKRKYKHPTIKPLKIIKNLIINSSKENDIILDCFSGSGTTCVAAKELGRRFIGIEIEPEYHQISLDRLNGILANGQISFDTDINKFQEEESNAK